MVSGIGCDIVEHQLSISLGWDKDSKQLSRIFSEAELTQIPSQRIKYLSGRFAAKEAVLKSFGTGMNDGLSLTEIQINQEKNGKPTVELFGAAKQLASTLGIKSIEISISHSNNYSISVAISNT